MRKTKEARERERIILNAKLSDLIIIALEDLRKCELMPKVYTIDMGTWHEPNSHCAVCFAGAVMAQTLGVSPKNRTGPGRYPTLHHAFMALDSTRAGFIGLALDYYNVSRDAAELVVNLLCKRGFLMLDQHSVVVTTYADNKKLFKQQMKSIAKALRAHGY